MHQKMSVLLAGLMLMVVTALSLPPKIEARGMLAQKDKIRVAAVVGVGTTQTLHLYINVHSDGRSAAPHQSEPGVAGVHIVLQNPNWDTGNDGVCRQTIQIPVNLTPGLNTVILQTPAGKELLVNGVVEELLNGCFDGTKRVVFIVGEITAIEPDFSSNSRVRPEGDSRQASRRGLFDGEFGVQFARHYSIVNSNDATAATGGLDLPQKFLIFEDARGSSH